MIDEDSLIISYEEEIDVEEINDNDYVVLTLYQKFKGWIGGEEKLDSTNIITLVTLLIPSIQKMVNGSDRRLYKKQVLTKVLKIIVKDSKIEKDQKIILNNIIDTTIQTTIDVMIGIAHGEINIEKKSNQVQNCCKLQ